MRVCDHWAYTYNQHPEIYDSLTFTSKAMLDGSGVKAMPGLIPTPNSGSL